MNQDGLIFEGMISIRAIIESGSRKIRKIYYDSKRASKYKKELAWLGHRAEESGFEIELCDKEEIEKLSDGSTHGGIIAICGERNIAPPTFDDIPENGFFMMLEGIEDPFNFGFAVRSAYAAGADGIILPERNWMSSAGTVCRSSAGASERIAMFTANDSETIALFKQKGYRVICADMPDSTGLWESDLKKPLLFVIGGEKRGISRAILDQADAKVRIDYGRDFPEALSAASASAILAFEVMRQNQK
ncbi:MAG: RNA methyltransferase [Clostridia bacterium]|nr:RNA methyltransferase [Clostridia bacterium]